MSKTATVIEYPTGRPPFDDLKGNNNKTSDTIKLEDSLLDCNSLVPLGFAFEFDQLKEILGKKIQDNESSYYHSMGLMIFLTVEAGSYLNRSKFDSVLKFSNKILAVIEKKRKKRSLLFKTAPNEFSDGES